MSEATNAFLCRLLGKQPPGLPGNRSLPAVHAHDKNFTFRPNKACGLPVQKLRQQDSDHFAVLAIRTRPGPIAPARAAYSKCPASMPERRGVRSSISRRMGQVLRTTLVRPPCACSVSKTKPDDKDRRLDKEGQHRIRPIVIPDMMILNPENFATLGKSFEQQKHVAEIVNACFQTPSCAIRHSGKTPNHELRRNRAGQIDHATVSDDPDSFPGCKEPGLSVRIGGSVHSGRHAEFRVTDRIPPSQVRKNTNQSTPRINTARPVEIARRASTDGPGSACRAWVGVSTI